MIHGKVGPKIELKGNDFPEETLRMENSVEITSKE